VPSVNVRLSGALSHYELRLPAGAEALAAAIKASLSLLELTSAAISFPLLAATYRARIGRYRFCPASSRRNRRLQERVGSTAPAAFWR